MLRKGFVLNYKTLIKTTSYYDVKGKICNFLNKFLHKTLFPHPSIILITIFCMLKIVELCHEFPQKYNTITHSQVKESMINHF